MEVLTSHALAPTSFKISSKFIMAVQTVAAPRVLGVAAVFVPQHNDENRYTKRDFLSSAGLKHSACCNF
jgi:hypothetical protein